MRKEREALLVATLAGLVILSAAAFVMQPSFGGKSDTAIRLGTSAGGNPIVISAT